MILPDPCVMIDPRRPLCAILDSRCRPTPQDPGGYMLIWTYGKTGGDAIMQMQRFVAMMLKEAR